MKNTNGDDDVAIFYSVSVGPGDPELMTLKAVRIIKSCPVIAAPRTGKGKCWHFLSRLRSWI
ncbi:MAG: hypothetical protein ILP19_07385 [Oscillospiraceae bacterium]|nr:hypothetical protein [Oscillospiraceae bacterium]